MTDPAAEAEQIAVVDLVEHAATGGTGELRRFARRRLDVLRPVVEGDARLAFEKLVGRTFRFHDVLLGKSDEEVGDPGNLEAMIDVGVLQRVSWHVPADGLV